MELWEKKQIILQNEPGIGPLKFCGVALDRNPLNTVVGKPE